MNRLGMFEKSYSEAYNRILRVLEGQEGAYDYELTVLTKWLLTTDQNISQLFEHDLQYLTNSMEGMSVLVSMLHHAMYDDGDVTFGALQDKPVIKFGENTHVDKKMTVQEFIEYADARHFDQIVKCYILDAAKHGSEFADNHYSTYAVWSETWKSDFADKIEERRQQLKTIGDVLNRRSR